MTAHGRKSDGFSSAHHSSAPHSVAANLGCQQLSGVRARPQPTVKGVKRRFLGGGAGLLNVPSAHFSTSFAPPPSTSHCLRRASLRSPTSLSNLPQVSFSVFFTFWGNQTIPTVSRT